MRGAKSSLAFSYIHNKASHFAFSSGTARSGHQRTQPPPSLLSPPPPSSPKAGRGAGSSQEQMTFSTETDACFSRHIVFVLSWIPPILIVTVMISITAFPPDFWLQEQITSALPTPRAVRLQKMSERPVLPGDSAPSFGLSRDSVCSMSQVGRSCPREQDHGCGHGRRDGVLAASSGTARSGAGGEGVMLLASTKPEVASLLCQRRKLHLNSRV